MKKIASLLFLMFALSLFAFANNNGYIVRIKDNTLENLSTVSMFADRAMLFSDMDDSEVVELLAKELPDVAEINSNHMLVSVTDEVALQELIDLGIVEEFEEDRYLYLFDYDVTTNPNYLDQEWYLDAINADFAWNAGVFGNDVKVAVVDSGVYQHDDLKRNIIPGKNYVKGFPETYTEDNSNHGTSVASIIASECNSLATVGISFKTKIISLKVTNDSTLTISLATQAIYDAVDIYECDVINLSFGDTSPSTSLYNAIKYAIDKNVIVVAAAGNWGNTGYVYPASYSEVVSVANVEKTSNGFSVRPTSQKNDMVDISAPGYKVHAIYNNGSVGTQNGTSFSCPMVSATAALAKSIDPDMTQSEFESLIKASANSSYIALSGQDSDAWGAGLLDIEEFIKLMNVGKDCFVSGTLTINDEAVVYITNLNDEKDLENCTVIISEYNNEGYLDKSKSFPVSLSAGENYRLSLSDYNFSAAAKVKIISNHIPGDIDDDKEVTLRDASAIMRYLAGYTVTIVDSALDVDGDGNVSLRDASAIMRYLAGYNVVLN